MANLSAVDAIVLILYLGGVVLLGLWIGRGRQDAKRYMLGDNNAPWWAILGSIVATETSTVTFLSVPGITFAAEGDMRFLQLALGYIAGRTVIVLWLLPHYFRGQIFTVYELLQERFGVVTRRMASLIFIVTRNLGDGLRLFLTALVLEATLDWSLPACVIAIGIATTIFTVFGGMQSVIWNDCIQLVVYMAGGVLAFFLITNSLDGGLPALIDFAQQSGRLQIFDFNFFEGGQLGKPRFGDTYTFWAGLIGGAFLTIGTHGTDQMMVQRLLASRSQSDAGRALIASGFVVLLQFALFLIVGIALASFYAANPPASAFESGDRVLSDFIVHHMPAGVGLIGLLLAAVFSAAISTQSSPLNSSATAVVGDWIFPTHEKLKSGAAVTATRAFTVLFGIIQMGLAIWAASFDEAVISNVLAIAGFSSGLLLGLFAIGLFIRSANQVVAIAGLGAGLAVLLVLKFVLPMLPEDSRFQISIAWPWYPVVGSLSTLGAGWLVSKLAGGSDHGQSSGSATTADQATDIESPHA